MIPMKIIPVITMQKRKMINLPPNLAQEAIEKIDEDTPIYIIDNDGILNDKPNICTFQRLSKNYDIWVDNAPRTIGDIVDTFMAGATKIVIRNKYCRELKIEKIREITDNEIFTHLEIDDIQTIDPFNNFYQNSDGLINFNSKEKLEANFKYKDIIKQFIGQKPIFTIENKKEKLFFWKNLGITNYLTDIENYTEFKKYEL
jgi:hypothetical protein